MITRETSMCSCNGTTRERQTLYGKSTDQKPENAENADIFLEMDTFKIFMFDAEAKAWLLME